MADQPAQVDKVLLGRCTLAQRGLLPLGDEDLGGDGWRHWVPQPGLPPILAHRVPCDKPPNLGPGIPNVGVYRTWIGGFSRFLGQQSRKLHRLKPRFRLHLELLTSNALPLTPHSGSCCLSRCLFVSLSPREAFPHPAPGVASPQDRHPAGDLTVQRTLASSTTFASASRPSRRGNQLSGREHLIGDALIQ